MDGPCGYFSTGKNSQIMKRMIETLFPIRNIATPYMYSHVVEALFHAGLHEEAIQLMKAYWGKMIELGADTFWEAFDPDQPSYSPYGSPIISSYCHAWSCTPVYLLEMYVLNTKNKRKTDWKNAVIRSGVQSVFLFFIAFSLSSFQAARSTFPKAALRSKMYCRSLQIHA